MVHLKQISFVVVVFVLSSREVEVELRLDLPLAAFPPVPRVFFCAFSLLNFLVQECINQLPTGVTPLIRSLPRTPPSRPGTTSCHSSA
ncbi:hypothetical protein T439DRAFT_321310 [Meredithblackwellia eburnea MCA 4105]